MQCSWHCPCLVESYCIAWKRNFHPLYYFSPNQNQLHDTHQLVGFPRARHFYESKLVTPILAVLSDLGLIGVCHRYTDRVHCALLLNIAAQISVLDLCFSSTNAIPSNSSRMFQILMIVKITPHPFLREIAQISFLLILQIAFLL